MHRKVARQVVVIETSIRGGRGIEVLATATSFRLTLSSPQACLPSRETRKNFFSPPSPSASACSENSQTNTLRLLDLAA